MTVGERIRQRRIELNMTQDELAKKAGYKSRSSINKIECSRDLPLSKVKGVATLLDCTPSYLMGWEESTDNKYSAEMAMLVGKIRNDKELSEALLKYFELSDEKKKHIVDMINMISK